MLNELLQEAESMQDYLEEGCGDNPHCMIERLSVLNSLMARSGKLLADAIRLQDEAISAVYDSEWDKVTSISPMQAKQYVSSKISEVSHAVKWYDRINATCKHQSDNLRTQISFAKEQMGLERKGY